MEHRIPHTSEESFGRTPSQECSQIHCPLPDVHSHNLQPEASISEAIGRQLANEAEENGRLQIIDVLSLINKLFYCFDYTFAINAKVRH